MTTALQRYQALFAGSSYRWNYGAAEGTPVVVTYSFMAKRPSYQSASEYPSFKTLSTAQKAGIRKALERYAAVTGLEFVEVSDSGKGGAIRFGQVAISGDTAGYGYYPGTSEVSGDVLLDHTDSAVSNLSPGSSGFELVLHEIGHALGLKHPFSGSHTLPDSEDNTSNTAMSYNDTANFSTVRPYDKQVLTRLYGSDWPDSVTYKYNASSKIMSFTGDGTANTIVGTVGNDSIGGGNGNDTLLGYAGTNILNGGAGNDKLTGGDDKDTFLGGSGTDSLVGGYGADLFLLTGDGDTARGLSGTDYDTYTDVVSYSRASAGVVITALNNGNGIGKVAGSSQSDKIYGMDKFIGSAKNDTLKYNAFSIVDGGAGNDKIQRTIYSTGTINGGDGTDVVVFDTNYSDATITKKNGTITVKYSSLTYTLTNVETLRFDDKDVAAKRVRAKVSAKIAAAEDVPVLADPVELARPKSTPAVAHGTSCPCCRLGLTPSGVGAGELASFGLLSGRF